MSYKRLIVASLLLTAAPCFAQSPSREVLVTSTQRQIQILNERFRKIVDDTSSTPVEMMAALEQTAESIHAQVDQFVRGAVADDGRVDVERLQNGLRAILPNPDEPRLIYEGKAGDGRYLIAAYAIYKGGIHGSGATSVTLRGYTVKGNTVRLSDVAGSNMDGYRLLSARQVRPMVTNPAAPPVGKTYLLLSGNFTGANGPNNRIRLYAYDGKKFEAIWMPENVWGTFSIQATNSGFVIDGDYYRGGPRNDEYTLSEDTVTLRH
jgi:hypothetical protein